MASINFTDLTTFDDDEDALIANGGLLINFADLTTFGDLANGIFGAADDVTIRNFGHVETSGLGAAGIFVQGDNARVENFGSVHTTGGFFGEFAFFSEGIFVQGDEFYIANHGTIQVEGESSSAMVGEGSDGLVVNFGEVDSFATNSAVVIAIGDRSQVINAGSGEVTVYGVSNTALQAAGEDASVLNLGQVTIIGGHSIGTGGGFQNVDFTNRGVISIMAGADFSVGMAALGDGHQLSNFGLIETQADFTVGMGARGGFPSGLQGADLELVNAGHISTSGDQAIGVALGVGRPEFGYFLAVDGLVVNSGVIETEGDGAAGVLMIGDGHHLINSGLISTDGGAFDGPTVGELRAAGVVVSGDDALVENTHSGIIESLDPGSAAVELNVLELERPDRLPAAALSSTLVNDGLIEGAEVAVLGGDGQETVLNHGSIVGDVILGAGDDAFTFGKGGILVGDLVLGDGNDLVVVEDGAGTAEIADFAAGAAGGDVIDVSAFFSNFDELLAHSQQDGDDVIIELDNNDTLIVADVQRNTLNDGDSGLSDRTVGADEQGPTLRCAFSSRALPKSSLPSRE
jgi:hypothetical protein